MFQEYPEERIDDQTIEEYVKSLMRDKMKKNYIIKKNKIKVRDLGEIQSKIH